MLWGTPDRPVRRRELICLERPVLYRRVPPAAGCGSAPPGLDHPDRGVEEHPAVGRVCAHRVVQVVDGAGAGRVVEVVQHSAELSEDEPGGVGRGQVVWPAPHPTSRTASAPEIAVAARKPGRYAATPSS